MNKLFEKFQGYVLDTPEKIALSSMGDGKTVTYRELDLISGKVYRYLMAHGIGREDFVNILLPRGVEPVIAMIGVWKAGAAFIMLEQDYPQERIAFIRRDCGCKLVIDDEVWTEILQCETLAGFAEVNDHDAAFAVYTSGTTGDPKGVLHEYGNLDLIARSYYENGVSPLTADDHFAMISPLHFITVILFYVGVLDAGGRMSIVPFSIAKNPQEIYKAFVENKIDVLFCAPSILRYFRNIPTVNRIIVGSEPANGIWSDDPRLRIWNAYSMSEVAFLVAFGQLEQPCEIAPVGKPLTDMKITLRDAEGRPVPEGETGELCVEDPYVRGYINRPEENLRAFVNGEFHTGDLARMLPDGQYVVLGRIDDMIKISGNRVEPAEIEVAVSRVSGLKQVIAAGFREGPDAFICLYYADPVEIDTEELRKKLESVLPYYMIPSRFIHLDALPRTTTGKISRRLLPKPEVEAGKYVAPENDTERALCVAMASVLGLERFGAEDDFYALGGSSVTSMEVVSICGLAGLSINQIFRGRTPKRIAEYYLEALPHEEASVGNEDNLTRPCPLTQSQLGIFLECEKKAGEAVYNNPMLFSLPDDTDMAILSVALEKTVRAHPGLFSGIVSDAHGGPAMRYQSAYAEREICIHQRMTEEEFKRAKTSLVQPFDIKRERLFRIRLIEAGEAKYLFMDFHHLVFDGTSMRILMADLDKALGGEDVEAEIWTAFDAAMAEQSARQDKTAWETARAWNLKRFGDVDSLALPAGDLRGSGHECGEQAFALDISYSALKAFCERQRTTENVLTTAAFGVLLSAYTLKKDALFTTVYNGRRDLRCHRTVSMFVTTLPVLCCRGGDLSVARYLSSLKEQLLGAMANDLYSFAELAAETGITSDVQFVWQADMLSLPKGSALKLKREELPFIATGDALSAQLFPEEDKLIFHLQYHADRYSEAFIARFASGFNQVLKDMMAKTRLSEVSLVSDEERGELLALSRGETLICDARQTWLDLFLENVNRIPEKTAVVDSEGSYTYRELDQASDTIAAFLRAHGVAQNSFVAVRMDRVKAFVAAVIGIHKAGAAYLPIDLDYPEERVRYMLSDSGAKLVLTEDRAAEILSAKSDSAAFDDRPGISPDQLAYMIYTSGSTGKPKGVMIQHRALYHFVQFIRSRWGLGENSRIALHSNFAFDAAVEDLFPPLAAGGTVCIVPESARRDPEEMRAFLRRYAINGGSYSTQFGQLLAADEPLDVDYLCVGGEAMTIVPKARGPVYNAYGPTEFTVDATYYELDKTRNYRTIPIGRPVHNCAAYIMDPWGGLLPRGFTGELCLAGPQIALGYWNQPELTREKFTPIDLGEGPVRIYHTGDLARYNGEGNLEYLGRMDTQVKLRGFRIELGEVESTAARYEGIALAAAEVKKDHLVLYYSLKEDAPGQAVDEAAFRDFLADSLADYMVPSIFMALDDMPLTPNGKIDRKALPEPERRLKQIVAPESPMEKQVLDLAAQTLGEAGFGVTDDLVSLGMSSLLAMRFAAALQSRHDARVRVSDIMKTPTVRGIAALIDKARHGQGMGLGAHEKRERYPLSENQRGLYIEWEINRNTTQYNIPAVYRFYDANAHALVKAVKAAVEAHPCLKIRLVTENGEAMQQRHDDERVEVTLVTPEHDLDQEYFQQRVRPFDLFRDRLYRFEVIDAPSGVYLFMDIHHILFDGLSANVFLRDVQKAYRGETLTPEHYDACDFALYERKLLDSDEMREAEAYYDSLVSEAEALSWPDSVHPDGMADAMVQTAIPAQAINAFCASEGVTVNSFMQAAFAEAMSRLTRETKGLSLTVSNGRSAGAELLSCVGMFVKTIPVVRPAVERDATAAEFIKAVHGQLQQSYAKEFYPYTRLVERRQIRPEIMMIYQGGVVESGDIDGIEPTDTCLTLDTVKFPIAVTVQPEEGRYVIQVEYDGTRYSGEDMMAMARAIGNMSLSLAENPLLADAETVDEQEIKQLLNLSCGEELPYNRDETWLTLFHSWVEKTPEHTAVADSEDSYTYAELDRASDKVALYLIAHGVTANSFVAVSTGRVKAFVAAVLGIQKAGAAYVPIDPEYPEERIAYMLADSGSQLVLDESLIGEVLSADGEAACAESSKAGSINRARPEGYAYMIYTSGSTGKPKGVVQSHRSLRAFIAWRERIVGRESVNAVHASFSFDASLDDLLCPLALGGQVHILSEALRRDLAGMKAYFEENRVTGVTFSTQIGMEMVNRFPDLPLRYVMMGGEKMLPCKKTDVRLINGYGPTEFTVCSSYHVVNQQRDDDIPIGRPVPNTWSLICDSQGHLLPRGMTGELCLAGPQIAEGYWKQPELTAEKFVLCPFLPGKKMYRTGDLARYNAAGELEYLGRIDHQVKLRGFRIELGEIESRASQYTGIQAVAAQVRRDQLVLYYTHAREITPEALRPFLAETLADYMVPAVYVPLDKMPMTPNGKIDRKALPEPTSRSIREYVACVGEAEEAVAAAMLQVLNMAAAPGALDSFFELGGDSIRAIRLSSLLRDGGYSVSVSDIMNLRTVRGIAGAAKTGEGTGISQEPFEGPVEDAPITAWFRSLALPEPWHFNQTQLLSLKDSSSEDRLDVNLLQKALNALVYQHDMLRAVYREGRLIVRGADAIIPVETYSASSEAEITKICAGIQSGIDMASALIRAALIHGRDRDYFCIAAHHLVIDGISWRIILADLESAFAQARENKAIRLPGKTSTYQDYARAVHVWCDSYRLGLEIPYWKRVQKKLLALPTSMGLDHSRQFGHVEVAMDAGDTARFLHTRYGAFNLEINDVLLTAVCRSFRESQKTDSLSVQMEGHGREYIGEGLLTDRTVGWFTSIYPVIFENLNGDLEHDLKTVKETLHRIPNKGVGYNILRLIEGKEEVDFPTDRVARIGFNYLGEMDAEASAEGAYFDSADIPTGPDFSPKNVFGPDLSINCLVQKGQFCLALDYNQALYSAQTARELADGILSQLVSIRKYLSVCSGPMTTASDLGETQWSEEAFEAVMADFAARAERVERIYPLLPLQEGMLLKHLSEPESWAYRLVSIFEMEGLLSEDQLRRALERLGEKHEVLRTAIIHKNVSIARQAIVDRRLGLAMTDLSGEKDPEAAVLHLREEILSHGFDLQNRPLFGLTCAKKDSAHCYLIVATHHIIVDGWCIQLYMGDLFRFLREELCGHRTEDTAPSTAGRYEAAVREILQKDMKQGLSYWRTLLSDYETKAEIPSYGMAPEGESAASDELAITLSAEETRRFEALCRREGATINNGTELLWGLVLGTCSRAEDVVFAKVVSGRDNTRTRVDDVVGLFINSVPVRVRWDRNTTARAALRSLQAQTAAGNAWDFCPLSAIQQETPLGSDLLSTVLAFENYVGGEEDLKQEGHLRPVLTREEHFDAVNPSAYVSEGRLTLHITFDRSLYREAEIQRVLELFGQLAREIIHNPDAALSGLKLLNTEASKAVVKLSGGAGLEYDRSETWLTLFHAWAEKTPDHTAVVDSEGSYTYAELDQASNAVAAYLIDHGVTQNSFVAVRLGRVKAFVAAVIGIQKAGAAYVPVDPDYPEERIAYILEDSEAKTVMTEETILRALEDYPNAKPVNRATPAHRAYMIYTSGSTGKPKGVIQSHRSLRAFTAWRIHELGIGRDSIHAVHASFAFDASLDDLICPLAAGGTIHILSDDLRRDMAGMKDYFARNHITALTMSTQIGMSMVNQYPDMGLRFVMMGGEKMLPCARTGIRLINGYGPTEFTVCSSLHVVDQEKDVDIPIGRPVPNTWSFICNEYGNLLPQGMAGELCLAGAQIAEGYWKQKTLTDEKFVPCPFLDGQDAKMYRTGDLARYNEDGELEFLGRIDTQVKLRGFRIELGEIETAASRYEGITHAVAEVCGDLLVLFYTANRLIEQGALRGMLTKTLTEYMIPSAFVKLDELPMTPNGKVDRKALRKMSVVSDEDVVIPENESERKLSDLVSEVLSGRKVSVTSELQREGLTSIAAMRLGALISQVFGKSFRLSDLKVYGTIRKIARHLFTESEEERFGLRASYPLSSVQQGIYVESMANFNSTVYNTPALLKLDRDVDIARLKQAIIQAVNAHPYMKMRLSSDENGQITAERRDDDPPLISETEFDSLQNGFDNLVYPFRLIGDSLFRISIIRSESANYLFMDGHHIAFDGESIQIFMRDINRAYAGETLIKESFTGFEVALLEEKLRQGTHFETAKEYYTTLLDGIDTDCLPVYDKDMEAMEIGYLTVDAPVDMDNMLRDVVKDGGVTLNGLWNAAFGLALSRFLYRDDSVYTTIYNGRNDSRLSESVGMFVHTLPVVCRVEEGESGIAYAKRIGQQLTDSMTNDIYSFAEISRQFDIKANIIFAYQGRLGTDVMVGGRKAESIPLELNAIKAQLMINVYEKDDGFEITCEYDSQHFEAWNVRALLKAAVRAFSGLIRDQKISEISLVSPDEKRMMDGCNQTERPVEPTDIVTLFRRTAEKRPQNTAVIYKDKVLTYQALDDLSDRVAAYLQDKGIGAGDVVGILIPRNEYMVVTALGALKAGAAYQPLDPTYPAERLRLMIEDSAAKALIEDEALKALIPDYAGVVLDTRQIEQLPARKPLEMEPGPDALFILLYTSGTTGVPKGVMLTHGNLVNFCQWYRNYFTLTEDSIVSAYASFGFDACMMDLYPALTTGACVCIVPEEMKLNPPELNAYFEKNRVSHAFMTTQMARMFAINFKDTHVKVLIAGGEKLVPFAPEGNFTFYNGYGPTECTIFSTIYPVEGKNFRVPIGVPLDNYKAYVVGKNGLELPVGAVGELWISGFGVAKGYLNKPELTEKAFQRNPFCDAPGFDRVYRTGDIVRRLPDGKIDFVGRKDEQVKIRGFRIELTEVEGAIRGYNGIRNATVQAFDDPSGNGKYIAAYVVADEAVDFAALSDYIRSMKPDYMVPSAFMQLDAIPLNQNQKVNRKKLPIPSRREEKKANVEPTTPLEKEICEAFARILGLNHVGALDSFFELGGTSITAASMLTYAIRRGYRIVYKDVFDNPTPRQLAHVIAGQKRSEKSRQAAEYDYDKIDRFIAYNVMEHVDEIASKPLGDVILTGATGFLGIHVLAAFLAKTEGRIYCLMRKNRSKTLEARLMGLMVYYFGETHSELFGNRIFCVEGDITDKESLLALDGIKADMIINCAACVKHFIKDDLLDRINYHGVENLIEACLKNDMKLVHVSTLSVGGSMPADQAGVLYENMLYMGQYVDNDYVRTKFLAERAILSARVERSLNAVILRAGNLMGRYTDGEFQINFSTNAFMRSFWAYKHLGVYPITSLAQQVEFSPIDATADAVLALAGVDSRFSIFNINNNHSVPLADIVFAMKHYGFKIQIVSQAEFERILHEASEKESESETIMSLLAYETGDDENLVAVKSDNFFTTNALYRLDFQWPIIDNRYLVKLIAGIDSLGFFDRL